MTATDIDDGSLHIIERLRGATSPATRAQILLQMPDAIVLSHGGVVGVCCAELGFSEGLEFLQIRTAMMHALRDAHGLLPIERAQELERWRLWFSAIASGAPTDATT